MVGSLQSWDLSAPWIVWFTLLCIHHNSVLYKVHLSQAANHPAKHCMCTVQGNRQCYFLQGFPKTVVSYVVHYYCCLHDTVEPLSKGHFGTNLSVHCREAVLFSGLLEYIASAFGTLWSVLYERLSLSWRVLYRRFQCNTLVSWLEGVVLQVIILYEWGGSCCSGTSEQRTLWDQPQCPLYRGCPLLEGFKMYYYNGTLQMSFMGGCPFLRGCFIRVYNRGFHSYIPRTTIIVIYFYRMLMLFSKEFSKKLKNSLEDKTKMGAPSFNFFISLIITIVINFHKQTVWNL